MAEWYYARDGKQLGPVDRVAMDAMIRQGELQRSDLVWSAPMPGWLPAGDVPGLYPVAPVSFPVPEPEPLPVAPLPPVEVAPAPVFVAPLAPASAPSAPVAAQPVATQPAVIPAPVTDRFLNPYATPQSERKRISPAPVAAAPVAASGGEIPPGSDPISIGPIIGRSWKLVLGHFGFIFLSFMVYTVIILTVSFATAFADSALGLVPAPGSPVGGDPTDSTTGPITAVVLNLVSIWLGLGLTRIGLNLVSGNPVALSQLFGEGGKILKMIVASCLFGLMVFLGFLALVIPGIYLVLRFGQFYMGILDRDLGVIESFKYSSALTTNNKWRIVLLYLAVLGVFLAGALALGVGLFVALPMIWLMLLLAFRWMQYGERAISGVA
ncbi:MAG: DUF975 family protein [Verrucomicrobia bacterium]|nr:DUF975 family protein [Verrucomicrobiota bacterium]